MTKGPRAHPTSRSVQEYARGATGGLLFSLPLLYTMEMWWAGFLASPARLLVGLAGTFVLLLGYNRYAGIREDVSMTEVAIDSVEELGLGLAGAACILWLLGRITPEMSAGEIIGRIVVQGLVGAIGVSVGTAQLGGGESRDQGTAGAVRDDDPWSHLALAACGAVLLAANVAPTEEIQVLGLEMTLVQLLLLALVSLGLCGVVLHFSEFKGTGPRQAGLLAPARSAVITYAVALLCSAIILWFFGRFDSMPAGLMAAQTVVLGLAAALGASAGRLLLIS